MPPNHLSASTPVTVAGTDLGEQRHEQHRVENPGKVLGDGEQALGAAVGLGFDLDPHDRDAQDGGLRRGDDLLRGRTARRTG